MWPVVLICLRLSACARVMPRSHRRLLNIRETDRTWRQGLLQYRICWTCYWWTPGLEELTGTWYNLMSSNKAEAFMNMQTVSLQGPERSGVSERGSRIHFPAAVIFERGNASRRLYSSLINNKKRLFCSSSTTVKSFQSSWRFSTSGRIH